MNRDDLLPISWYWKRAVPHQLIDYLLDECETMPKIAGSTFSDVFNEKEDDPDLDYRNSDILLFDPIHWFSSILVNVSLHSNRNAGWNYKLTFPESFQVAYYGENQHYKWHADSNQLVKFDIIRKLTCVCMLSDSSKYEGGELELENGESKKMEKGDIVVFPSFVRHRVKPVTSGLRVSATTWYLGDRSL